MTDKRITEKNSKINVALIRKYIKINRFKKMPSESIIQQNKD